jgi:hypothetical protein
VAEPVWLEELPGISVWRTESAEDFLDALRRSKLHWWEGTQMPWAFRGHANEGWPLLPSAWRDGNLIIAAARQGANRKFERVHPRQSLHWRFDSLNFITGPAQFGDDQAQLQRQLTIEATAEVLPVFDFILTCDRLGLTKPVSDAADRCPAVLVAVMPSRGLRGETKARVYCAGGSVGVRKRL